MTGAILKSTIILLNNTLNTGNVLVMEYLYTPVLPLLLKKKV